MKKLIIQGVVSVLVFFGAWLALSQLDWMKIFSVQKVTDKTEQKLGSLFWDVYKKSETVNKNTTVQNSVDSIVTHICKENDIDRTKIKLHILTKDEVNAFALPNGYLVVYTGLILNAANQEELTGVICHEIAHIELNHVMRKLVKEIGLSVLVSMSTGGGTEIIKETAKSLSSLAFDRTLEKEADIKAVDYLLKAKVNPEPFANFLYKLAENEIEATKYLTWVSTHPDSKERAADIIKAAKVKKIVYKQILSTDTWQKMQVALKE